MIERHHHQGDEQGGQIELDSIVLVQPETIKQPGLYRSGGELYCYDISGNNTQLSPHNKLGEWVFNCFNTKTGKTFKVNMEKLVRIIEQLSGEILHEEN